MGIYFKTSELEEDSSSEDSCDENVVDKIPAKLPQHNLPNTDQIDEETNKRTLIYTAFRWRNLVTTAVVTNQFLHLRADTDSDCLQMEKLGHNRCGHDPVSPSEGRY